MKEKEEEEEEVTSGFRRGAVKASALLGCYAG
jgi:hypothetical protein